MGPGRIRKRKIKKPIELNNKRSVSRRIPKRPPKPGLRINRAAITEEMLEKLEEDLNDLWNENSIPQYHQEVFHKYLRLLPKESAAAMLAKEVDDLK